MFGTMHPRVAQLMAAFKGDPHLKPEQRTEFAKFIFSFGNLAVLVPQIERDLSAKYTYASPPQKSDPDRAAKLQRLQKIRDDAWLNVYTSLRIIATGDIYGQRIVDGRSARCIFMERYMQFIGDHHWHKTKSAWMHDSHARVARTLTNMPALQKHAESGSSVGFVKHKGIPNTYARQGPHHQNTGTLILAGNKLPFPSSGKKRISFRAPSINTTHAQYNETQRRVQF